MTQFGALQDHQRVAGQMGILLWTIAVLALFPALGYAIAALFIVRRPASVAAKGTDADLPVTIFKPLCGAEPGLYESLRSFFVLDPARIQLVFGVRNPSDPALDIVARLRDEFPAVEVAIARDSRVHGTNLKISNLINMAPLARHDVWVISDSDIRVDRDYLHNVLRPLADPQIGVVTALYKAAPLYRNLPCRLAALNIDDGFLPSVLVAREIGRVNFCLGSTMAMRRDALEAIGGFAALKDYLADDYMLGRLMDKAGFRVALAEGIVSTTVSETRFSQLLDHELRWARTIRSVEPRSFLFSCAMNTVSMSLLAALLLLCAGAMWPAFLAVALGVAVRLGLHMAVSRHLGRHDAPIWLVPLRDVLSFGIWLLSFKSRSVAWRGHRMDVDSQGVLMDALREGTP